MKNQWKIEWCKEHNVDRKDDKIWSLAHKAWQQFNWRRLRGEDSGQMQVEDMEFGPS